MTQILFFVNLILIQGPCPPCCSTGTCGGSVNCSGCPPPPPGLEIDNFTVLLLLAGLAYGVWFFNKLKKTV